MNIETILKSFINDNTKDLMFGIETTMTSIASGAIYTVSASGGNFNIVNWSEENQGEAPTSDQIRKEYNRQESFVEFYNYLKNEQPEVFELLMKKLGYTD